VNLADEDRLGLPTYGQDSDDNGEGDDDEDDEDAAYDHRKSRQLSPIEEGPGQES
jgi:hypothetical protein